jgi:hypothetical protein
MTKHEYIEGFESGCNFIVTEVERYAKVNHVFLGDLICHLKGENTPYAVRNFNDENPQDKLQNAARDA